LRSVLLPEPLPPTTDKQFPFFTKIEIDRKILFSL
jgi:hypothetical protein